MTRSNVWWLGVVALAVGCTGGDGPELGERAHDARFVGLWAVEQNTHAAYEVTFYEFGADGVLAERASWPADCTGHLSQHCVTGSVANCIPEPDVGICEASTTCVFGDRWYSLDAATLVIVGECSDGRDRDIVFAFNPDASTNAEFGGAGAELVTVDGSTQWSHDNWPWSFRKCADSADPSSCSTFL